MLMAGSSGLEQIALAMQRKSGLAGLAVSKKPKGDQITHDRRVHQVYPGRADTSG